MDVNPQESRTNKRKLQDTLESLDDAVNSTSTVDRPPPPKRQNTIKSLYSTLAKYGIRTKAEEYPKESPQSPDLSKTPRLAAILSRAGTKTRKVLPFTRRPTTRVTSDYRPSSTSSFLVRLETYKLNTYSNKPPEIDAVAASKCGWVNEGKDRLQCGLCGASWVVAGRDKMSRDAANALVKKQQAQLIDNHKDGCPWKARQCDPDVYRIQLSSPAGMAKDIKSRALQLTPLLENVEIKHPLLQSQTQSLEKTIASVHLDEFVFSPDAEASSNEASLSTTPEPSFPAVLAALFGWSVAPPMPAPSRPVSRSGTPSLSRAGSVAPSAPSTPRRSSVLPQDHSHIPTCGPSSASLTSPTLARVNTRLLQTPRATPTPEQQSGMLYCSLCHRRLGLWAFGSSSTSPAINIPASVNRQVDVLKEHRPYCPYVTRSTVLPTLPVSRDQPGPGSSTASLTSMASTVPGISSGPVEGWRAVLLVVLRYRMSQRHWDNLLNGLARRADGHADQADNVQDEDVPTEADPVDAMVADVKKKGGRELLSYVKGLLG